MLVPKAYLQFTFVGNIKLTGRNSGRARIVLNAKGAVARMDVAPVSDKFGIFIITSVSPTIPAATTGAVLEAIKGDFFPRGRRWRQGNGTSRSRGRTL